MSKRLIDVCVAIAGLVIAAPLMVLVAILIKLDSRGPVLFRQVRIGRGFRPFEIYKFRTMVDHPTDRQITVGDDPRITRVGRFLRRTKLDELPQLTNVVKGDMSLVGPRPEVPRYVEKFKADYAEILRVRPGLTDLASLKFIDEARVLAAASDPEAAYEQWLLPEKIALAQRYVRERSLWLDLTLLARTLTHLTVGPLGRSLKSMPISLTVRARRQA